MKEQQQSTDISKQQEQTENCKDLALNIWNIIVSACNELHIPRATLSISGSDIILSYPSNDNLKSITFSCNDNKEDVLSIFRSIAEKSDIEGKIFCIKNLEINLHFRY